MTKYKFGFMPFIFIETDFKRKNEPIFALAAMESSRRIRIPNEISVLPLETQIPLLKQIIRDHFSDTGGVIPMWGMISLYKHFYDEHNSLVFNIEGNVITQDNDSGAPYARVTVKGKDLLKVM